MSYTSSPYAAKARFKAAKLVVKCGLKKAVVARMNGVHKSTISRWVEKFPKGHHNFHNEFLHLHSLFCSKITSQSNF